MKLYVNVCSAALLAAVQALNFYNSHTVGHLVIVQNANHPHIRLPQEPSEYRGDWSGPPYQHCHNAILIG